MFAEGEGDNKPVSLLVIDVDHFKPINDTYGHDAGDVVLQELAKRIVGCVRGIDVACRYGGEEFVLLMPNTDSELASMIAERLREDIEDHPIVIDEKTGKEIRITVSIGIATSEAGDNQTAQQLLKRADDALYEAKNQGRNQVVCAA